MPPEMLLATSDCGFLFFVIVVIIILKSIEPKE
jgi:hypothetical protein